PAPVSWRFALRHRDEAAHRSAAVAAHPLSRPARALGAGHPALPRARARRAVRQRPRRVACARGRRSRAGRPPRPDVAGGGGAGAGGRGGDRVDPALGALTAIVAVPGSAIIAGPATLAVQKPQRMRFSAGPFPALGPAQSEGTTWPTRSSNRFLLCP